MRWIAFAALAALTISAVMYARGVEPTSTLDVAARSGLGAGGASVPPVAVVARGLGLRRPDPDGLRGGVEPAATPASAGPAASGSPAAESPLRAAAERERASYPAELVAAVCAQPWPCEQALAVAWCEMGQKYAPAVVSRTGDYGIFQLHAATHALGIADFWQRWMDPAANAAWAYQIYSDGGWRQWSCKP